MKTGLRGIVEACRTTFLRGGLKKTSNRNWARTHLRCESLESRALLATLYVDNAADYTITNDADSNGTPTNGDTVTWNPGAGSQHGAAVAGLVVGTTAFTSIQAAVTASTAGDTIRVGPGTFAEGVNINKQLTVLGNQTGLDAQTGRIGAAETIVTGAGNNGVTPFQITANDVVLDGFTIEGATNVNQFGFGILIGAGTNGTEISNNIIQSNIAGISLANNSATNQTVIEQNLIRNNNQAGPVNGTGIYTDQFNAGGPLLNVLIDNNTFTGNSNVAVLIGPTTAASSATDITISRNVISTSGNAILLFNTLDSTITQNEISASTGSQVVIGGGNNGIDITQNIISGGSGRGIRIGDLGGGSANQNVTINRNSITGNATAGLEIDSGGYIGAANSLNAEFNWWGSATGPTIASNPGGTGSIIVDPLGQVDYVPFLTSGTDSQPGTRGFQPVVADLSITKTDSPDPVVPGGTLTYTITVTNNGPDTQTSASIADTFPAGFNGVLFTSSATGGATGNTASGGTSINDTVTMPAGSTITYTVTGTVASSTSQGTVLTNTATVTAGAGTTELNTTNNSATATTTVGAAVADLSVVKTDSPDPVIAGNNLTYTIIVSNVGPSDAQSVSLSDAIPANTTFVSFAAPAGWTPSTPGVGGTGTVTATRSTLAPASGPQTFTLVVQVNSSAANATTLTNTATVSTTTADPVSTNNSSTATTTVNASADLSVTKTDSADPVNAGGNITYTITLANTGPSDAQTVSLADAIPAGTTFVSASQTSGPTFTLSSPAVGGTGTFTATADTLSTGATAVFQLVVRVNASTPQGTTITNTATATTTTADSNAANNSDVETTAVNAAANLQVTKTDSADPVNPGENLTYTITVSNLGSSDAQTVALTDVIPANTTFVSASQTSGPAFTLATPAVGGTGTFTATATAPTFAAGATATFALVVQVDSTAAPGSEISNTVTVTTTTTDSNPTNNTDTETTTVQPLGLPECEVTTLNSPGEPGTASIEDDADNPGENVLIVTGTSKNDVIVVEPQPKSKGMFRVVQNKRVIVTFISTDVPRIVVFGLAGNDVITVNSSMSQSSKLFGDEGNDVIKGGKGDDGIDGGSGNDKLYGIGGNDTICGGDGNDIVFGGSGNDLIGGEAGNDKLYGESGNDLVLGGDGNDNLYGSSGDDRLYGQLGNDLIYGDSGNDIAVGGDGNDKIYGGAGRDLLIGGVGVDSLFGGAGDDILIGGTTAHDEDDDALQAILSEWASSRNYNTRITNLKTGGGNNGVFTLDDATVSDDGDKDTLAGEGNQDWFLVGDNDKVKDKAKNELLN
jgi:uncharacterized repeat protein (TIGR01451 family)